MNHNQIIFLSDIIGLSCQYVIMVRKIIPSILISIIIVGMIGIPMGDPRFLTNAIILESIFALLAAISFWRINYILIPNMIIAALVIAGNTLSPKHIEIMSSLNPFENSIVLILGGYVLQALLFGFSLYEFKKREG